MVVRIHWMGARIYKPARTAMQSGTAMTKRWILEFDPASARRLDPLMGWTSSDDMRSQVRLEFDSKEAAIQYAEKRSIPYTVSNPKARRPVVRQRGYAENFAHNRREAWTH